MSIRMQLDINGLKKYSHNLDAFAKNAKNTLPLMQDIAEYGVNSTKARFKTGTAPDGQKWPKSIRVQMNQGGQTLVDTGKLRDSYSADATPKTARWGTNDIRARMLHFGGTIRAKSGNLKFKIPGLGFRTVAQVVIPSRPQVGINKADEQIIEGLIIDHLRSGVVL